MASSKVAVVNVMGSYFFCYMSLVQLVFFVNNSMSLQVVYIWVLRLQKEIFNSIIIRKKGFLNINFNLERNFADIRVKTRASSQNVGKVSFRIKVGIQRAFLSYARAN